MYDVIIIGAGVSGTAVARELSKYQVKVCVVEKGEDVCSGTSKANSAIIHAGYDAATGSLMAKLNVLGNTMMPKLANELDIPFHQVGSLVVCLNKNDIPSLQSLYERGIANGVKGLELITEQEKIFKMEPNLAKETVAVLHAPTAGIICPFTLNIALAENANENGVEFQFQSEVTNVEKDGTGWKVSTTSGIYHTKYVVNAAGVYGDQIHNMVSNHTIKITARKGDYLLLDKRAGQHIHKTIFALPSKLGKGILVTPTIHGNLLVGPTAVDREDKNSVATTQEELDDIQKKAKYSVKDIPFRQVITSFAGLRAHENGHEFLIGELDDAPGFIDCVGIESPGLSSCPAIGLMVVDILQNKERYPINKYYKAKRKGILNPQTLSKEDRIKLISENPTYGNIICRCEMISEGEILDAIHRPLGARSLDAVKRRTRAGMGRCQGGFCSPKVMGLISRECNIDMLDITKAGGESKCILGVNRQGV